MPHWGLVVTSIGFIFPSMIAYKHKRKVLSHALQGLTLTSILFHGTNHIVFRNIDIGYVYTLATIYITKNFLNLINKKRKEDIYINTGTLISLYYYFNKCDSDKYPMHIRKKNHMLFHILTQFLFSYGSLYN